ncbi:MAG: argininosuccinate lyase, partial [Vicinamibacterales bacterium]
RNPVALEHARAIASKTVGQASAIILVVHNTPFGDIVDTEDDLQPLVFTMFRDAARAVRLVAAALSGAQFNTPRMAERASEGWITVTELADTLARDHGMSFKAGHAIASRLVAARSAGSDVALSHLLRKASEAILGRAIEVDDSTIERILSPRHFVATRTTHGGPAPSETARAIAQSESILAADAEWFAAAVGRLKAAEEGLRESAAAL